MSSTSSTAPMLDTQQEYDEQFDGDGDDDDDDDFSRDGYSHSMASMQSTTSLPPTPEPRNVTPTQQHSTRPSSKASTLSMTSYNSGAATSSPPPERKATSYINVSAMVAASMTMKIPIKNSHKTEKVASALAHKYNSIFEKKWSQHSILASLAPLCMHTYTLHQMLKPEILFTTII